MHKPFLISAVCGTLAFSAVARAELVINITQDGSNVVATMSGEVNTAGLSLAATGTGAASSIIPKYNEIF